MMMIYPEFSTRHRLTPSESVFIEPLNDLIWSQSYALPAYEYVPWNINRVQKDHSVIFQAVLESSWLDKVVFSKK